MTIGSGFHWVEYCLEAAGLGLFMVSACVFAVLLGHPMSPVPAAVDDSMALRALMGGAMGTTAVLLIVSPLGQRSGAHFNPAVTLTFYALGKIRGQDAVFYLGSQFLGGLLGVQVADFLIGPPLSHPVVNHVATVPGSGGMWVAFGAELAISMGLMLTVLTVSNKREWSRYTPFVAGSLVALFIFFEAPLSGMSMNPARTLGSAVGAWEWRAIWIYFVAPVAGMLTAALLYRLMFGGDAVLCAKLHHHNRARCIFRCRFME